MKKKYKFIVGILAFALFIGGGGALLGTLGKRLDNAFTSDFEAPNKIDELWGAGNFNKNNVQTLFDKISGWENCQYEVLNVMANARLTATEMIANAGGEISIMLGGLEWTPTYLSTSTSGVILTLWMSNNEQDAFQGLESDPEKIGKFHGFIKSNDTGKTGLYSDWAADWDINSLKDGVAEFYPGNMYGTSYIRSVTLNNGGQYAINNTELAPDPGQDENSVFAKFTMESVSNLTNYIVAPINVSWQAQQSYTEIKDSSVYSNSDKPNDAYAPLTPGTERGNYPNSLYNFAEYNNYDAWKNDKLWIPSLTEVEYDRFSPGLWGTSAEQVKNYKGASSSSITVSSAIGSLGNENVNQITYAGTETWLRSGYNASYDEGHKAFELEQNGEDERGATVYFSDAVRPALHLNLTQIAIDTGLFTGGGVADKFDNEDTADGSKEHPYEIATAAQFARFTYLVNSAASASTDEEQLTALHYCTSYYKQTADISLGSWTPIMQFMGVYDGGGYNLDGLRIKSGDMTVGLFMMVADVNIMLSMGEGVSEDVVYPIDLPKESGVVRNLTIRSGEITGPDADMVGGIAGMVVFGKIENCTNYADISAMGGGAAGIVGTAVYSEIKDCVNYGDITGVTASGIVASTGTELSQELPVKGDAITISGCINYGDIYALYAGGIVVDAGPRAIISNCIVYGEISASAAGAFAFIALSLQEPQDDVKFINCRAYCSIIVPEVEIDIGSYIIGISNSIFVVMSGVDTTYRAPSFVNCFFIGNIEGMKKVNFSCTTLYSDEESISLDSCYAIVNGIKIYSNGDFSGWTVSEKFNNGLPVQKEPYWSLQFAPSINEEYFSGWTKRTV